MSRWLTLCLFSVLIFFMLLSPRHKYPPLARELPYNSGRSQKCTLKPGGGSVRTLHISVTKLGRQPFIGTCLRRALVPTPLCTIKFAASIRCESQTRPLRIPNKLIYSFITGAPLFGGADISVYARPPTKLPRDGDPDSMCCHLDSMVIYFGEVLK